MTLYVFGNPDFPEDAVAFEVAKHIQSTFPHIPIVEVGENQDIPFENLPHSVILDVVMGIKTVTLMTEKDIDRLVAPPRDSVHDYDLGFQLKYLRKLGHINHCWIIGLPYGKKVKAVEVILMLQELLPKLTEQQPLLRG